MIDSRADAAGGRVPLARPRRWRTIQGLEVVLWLRTIFGFTGIWIVREQNQRLASCFAPPVRNKSVKAWQLITFYVPAPGLRHAR